MADGRMHAGNIDEWLREHGGLKSIQEKWEEEKTPSAVSPGKVKRTKHIIRTANDGQVLEIADETPATAEDQQAAVDRGEGYFTPEGTFTPTYAVIRKGDPDNTDTRSPEKKKDESRDAAEREWNVANGPTPNPASPAYDAEDARLQRGSGLNETHSERLVREAREKKAADDEKDAKARRDEAAATAANRAKELEVSEARAAEDARHNKAGEDTAAANTRVAETNAAASTASAAASTVSAETGAAREAREARTPHVIGTPTDKDKSIAYIDPATGEIKSGANPLFDQKKAEAEFEKERLRLLIEQNKMTAEVAAAQYKQWYDTNVAAPLALAAERRAQAQEKRQALQAEEQRKQFQASNEVERAKVGETAANRAVDAEKSLLPYRVGGTFAGNFSDAVNGLAAGGKMDANAASGVHFQASDFTFQAPNFAKIGKKAAREAVKHLTPYDPSDQEFDVGDYTGLQIPTSDTLGTMPAAPAYNDTASGINNLVNPYSVPQ